MNRNTTRVIAPVFQSLQALDEYGNNIALGDRADDAAHGGSFLKLFT
jgi:hypothetical protein